MKKILNIALSTLVISSLALVDVNAFAENADSPKIIGSRKGSQFGDRPGSEFAVEGRTPEASTRQTSSPGSHPARGYRPYEETVMMIHCVDYPNSAPGQDCKGEPCEGDGIMMFPMTTKYDFPPTPENPAGVKGFTYMGSPRCVHDTPSGASLYTAAQVEFLRSKPKLSAPGSAPPGGVTLVGLFNTLFWTSGEAQVVDQPLLGTPVRLRITPTVFTWNFSDGTQLFTTDYPGIPHDRNKHPLEAIKNEPDPRKHRPYVTHRYTQARVICHTRVTVEYTGEYSINGGPYHTIDGTITHTSPPRAVTTVEYRAELVTGPHAPQPTVKPPPSPRPDKGAPAQGCQPDPHWNK